MMSLCQLDRSPLYGQLLQSILGEELFLTLLLISVNIKYVFQSQSTVLSFKVWDDQERGSHKRHQFGNISRQTKLKNETRSCLKCYVEINITSLIFYTLFIHLSHFC